MADLYGRPPSPATEPEEISSFIHQILHNPSSSSKSTNRAFSSSSLPRPETASSPGLLDPRRFGRSGPECQGGGSSVNFSDPGGCFAKENVENAVSSVSSKRRGFSVENDAGDFSCDSEGAAEVPSDKVRPRSSSKRSRTAEVHNLSEKRRRSRINEKMKALQNLIPNSNKTDKASMLDEAIEYLKQLQLQVQMLTMRNGLSLNPPMYFPGILQPLQLPLAGLNFDEENILLNTNRVTGAFGANEENSVHTSNNILSHSNISNQPMVIPSRTKVNSPDTSFSFDSLIQVHHGPFNLSASSKEICGEGAPQRQLDTNQTVKTSSSSMPWIRYYS